MPPVTSKVPGNGTGTVSFSVPPDGFKLQSVVAVIDGSADLAPVTAELSIADPSGVVIAYKRQSETIPATESGTATWALRLDDELTAIAPGGTGFLGEMIATGVDAVWRLDEPAGTIANDATGNGHYATVDGTTAAWASIVPPKASEAPLFAPLQGFISSGSGYSPNLAGDFTAAVWFRPHIDDFSTVMGTSVHGGTLTGWDFTSSGSSNINPLHNTVVIGTGAGTAVLVADNAYTFNTWYWLAVTRSGTTWHFYINAVQQTATYTGAYSAGGARPVWIGYDNSGSFGMAGGYLSYGALWSTRALTGPELATIYSAT